MPQEPQIKWDDLPDVDFTNLPDNNQPTPTPVTQSTPAPESGGWMSDLWHKMSDPLITAPSRWASEAATKMTDPNNKPGWLTGFGAGALEGTGNLVSSLSSPLNLVTALLTGGESAAAKAGLPQIARLAGMAGKASAIPTMLHGGEELLNPESTWGQRATGVAEIAGGAIPFAHTPTVNPHIANAVKTGEVPRPGLMSDMRDMMNEIKGGEAPILQDNSIGGMVGRIEDNESALTDFNNSRVAKTLPREGDINLDGLPDNHPNDVEDLIKQLGNKDGEVIPTEEGALVNNGSGDSSASVEAINRQSQMKAKGQQYVVYDKAGNERPIIGPDAVDYKVQPGESYGIKNADGSFQLLDNAGGKFPTQAKVTTPPNEPAAVYIKKPDPEVIKQVMQKGYVFDSLRDDGAFKMVKSNKPVGNLPVLESEVAKAGAAPTPANAARMAAGGGPPITPEGKTVTGGAGKGPGGKIIKPPSTLHEAYNFPRTVMASMDFSAPLRQGLGLIHKKQFWTSLDDMVKAWGSEKAYDSIQQSILEKPLFKSTETVTGKPRPSFAEQAGVKLTDLHSLSTREENMMSTWADKVPGVRRSNRAYTAFLNKLRADTFEDLVTRSKVFGADATVNLPLARELAEFVNTASGRGSLGKLEKSAVALNGVLFSPRLIASRVKMLNPATYVFASPTVRKEYLKSLLAIASVGTTVTQLGKIAGGTVESDPASSDFGKLKIGNTRLDPYGGFQQYIVAANRLLTARNVSSTSGKEYDLLNPKGPYDPTYMDTMTRFGRSKLHPVLGFAVSLAMGGKEMTGQKMDLTSMNPLQNSITQRFIPIVIQDVITLAQEDPSLLPVLGPLTAAGMSTQVYGGSN